MKNGKGIPLTAPDSERAMFDTINYRGQCRRAELEAREAARAREAEERIALAKGRANARKRRSRRIGLGILLGTWAAAFILCYGIGKLYAGGILSTGWAYLLSAMVACTATYISGFLNGRRKLW